MSNENSIIEDDKLELGLEVDPSEPEKSSLFDDLETQAEEESPEITEVRNAMRAVLKSYAADNVDGLSEPVVTIIRPVVTFMSTDYRRVFGELKLTIIPNEEYFTPLGFESYIEEYVTLTLSPDTFTKMIFSDILTVIQPTLLTLVFIFVDVGGSTNELQLSTMDMADTVTT
jgi:hypothetical protein